MIDARLKRSLGQMVKAVQVVAAEHEGVVRGFTCHWVMQVAFEEPVLVASISPKHDTHPLVLASGAFTVSLLAADQLEQGQYFGYPGHRFRYVAPEWLAPAPVEGCGWIVPDCVAWLRCTVEDVRRVVDHDLVTARVTEVGEGRLKEPPLLYSSRHGWRTTGGKARGEMGSVRDALLARVAEMDPEAG